MPRRIVIFLTCQRIGAKLMLTSDQIWPESGLFRPPEHLNRSLHVSPFSPPQKRSMPRGLVWALTCSRDTNPTEPTMHWLTTVTISSRPQPLAQIDWRAVSQPDNYEDHSASADSPDYPGPQRREFVSYFALWRSPAPQGRIYQSVTVTSAPDAMERVYCRIGEGVGLVHLRELAGAE